MLRYTSESKKKKKHVLVLAIFELRHRVSHVGFQLAMRTGVKSDYAQHLQQISVNRATKATQNVFHAQHSRYVSSPRSPILPIKYST